MIILSEKIMMIIWSINITFRKNIVSTLIDEPLKGVAEEITIWQVHKSAEKKMLVILKEQGRTNMLFNPID